MGKSPLKRRFTDGQRTPSWSGWFYNVMPVFGLVVGFLFISLLILVPPFALFSFFFAKKLNGRPEEPGRTPQQPCAGAITKPVARSKGQDEIAQLQADFNIMADNLEQNIDELKPRETGRRRGC